MMMHPSASPLLTNALCLALLVAAFPSAARGEDDRRPVVVHFRGGAADTLKVDKYDRDHRIFRFKDGKTRLEHDVRTIAALSFEVHASPIDTSDGAHDLLIMNDGRRLGGYFRGLSDDKVRFCEARVGEQTAGSRSVELARGEVQRIVFGREVLDVDRHDYGTEFNVLGDELEIALAVSFAGEIAAGAAVLQDSLVSAYVNDLGQRIAAASQRPEIEYSFTVLNSRTVNAFTSGGGQVFIYRGLIECMGSEAELAGVIAHEVGHIVGKHTARALTNQLIMAGIVGGGAELLGGDNEKRRAAIQEAGGAIAFLRQMKYSRDDEREADFLAVYSLYRLGYDPTAMAGVFDTFRKLGGDPSQLEVFFQDHPAPAERIEYTSAELPKLNLTGLRSDSAAFVAVKARLAGLEYPLLSESLGKVETMVAASAKEVFNIQISSEGASESTLVARLEALGGSGNDVRVLLFDEDNYLNWSNGHKAEALFDGGQTTVTQLQAKVVPGRKYVLVLDNSFSWMAEKRVVGELFVQYRE